MDRNLFRRRIAHRLCAVPSGSQRIGQQISVSSLRTYVSDRVEKSVRTEWKNLFLATHSWGEYKLKCPNCGAADYCANLDKKKKK